VRRAVTPPASVTALVSVAALASGGVLAGCGSGTRPQTRALTSSAPAATPTTTSTTTTAATSTTTTATTSTTTTAAASTTAAPTGAEPTPSTELLGINVNRLFNDGTYTAAQIDAQLTALHATSAMVARSDAFWEFSEPAPPVDGVHHYDWSFDDEIAGDLAEHGLEWLPIIDYSALWNESVPDQDHSPPASDADYAAYAQAFAARFGAGGAFWREHPALSANPVTTFEIWNEPDNGEFWDPSPDAAAYADLYLAARAAIDAVDPSARVIIGGLVSPTAFLPAMLAASAELAGHVDGVAIHPYGQPDVVLAKIRDARAALVSLGMAAVPLYVTEFGWTTDPPGALDYVPASSRTADILTTLSALGHLNCDVAAAILYTWVTPQRDPDDSGDWFGVHSPDGGSTADTAAFAAGVRQAAAPGPTEPLCPG